MPTVTSFRASAVEAEQLGRILGDYLGFERAVLFRRLLVKRCGLLALVVGAIQVLTRAMTTAGDDRRRVLFSSVVSLRRQLGLAVSFVGWPRTRAIASCSMIVIAMATISCAGRLETALERLSEALRLSADLLVQFTKAVDAGNRAVMADTDEASVEFADEARQATQAVQRDRDELGPILVGLGYSPETGLLEEFNSAFAQYRALDRAILELAVENTNLKAQRLSFGSALEAADAFRNAVESVTPAATTDTWRIRALAATAVASVREIQALQAPHIAEPDDASMTRMEKRMAMSEAAARSALETIGSLIRSESRPRLAGARAALDRFMGVHAEILALSRRNTNVRSLALSLGQKRSLTAKCEEGLHALQDALAKRGLGGTR